MTEGPGRDAETPDDGRQVEEDGPAGTDDPFDSLPEVDAGNPFMWLDDGAAPGERTPAGAADPFEEVDVDTADEVVWEDLVSPPGPTDSTDGVDPTTVGETVVPKRGYCQGCEYLATPPDVACTHPDGEILEAVDIEHFRVRNCPVVAHRRERSIFGDVGPASDD